MKQDPLPYLPLYPKDFLGDTGTLSASKFGAYTRLLYTSWIEPLYNDMEDLTEITRVSESVTHKILDRYFILSDGVWVNNRLEEERVLANKRHQAAVNRGKAGSDSRWNKDRPSNSSSNSPTIDEPLDEGMLTHNPELITNKSESKTQKERVPRKRFTPPVYVDVVKRMINKELKNSLANESAEKEASKFISFYSSNGWKVGRNKMVSWESAVDGWLSRLEPEDMPYTPQVD